LKGKGKTSIPVSQEFSSHFRRFLGSKENLAAPSREKQAKSTLPSSRTTVTCEQDVIRRSSRVFSRYPYAGQKVYHPSLNKFPYPLRDFLGPKNSILFPNLLFQAPKILFYFRIRCFKPQKFYFISEFAALSCKTSQNPKLHANLKRKIFHGSGVFDDDNKSFTESGINGSNCNS
jgi:hypothetical protein